MKYYNFNRIIEFLPNRLFSEYKEIIGYEKMEGDIPKNTNELNYHSLLFNEKNKLLIGRKHNT